MRGKFTLQLEYPFYERRRSSLKLAVKVRDRARIPENFFQGLNIAECMRLLPVPSEGPWVIDLFELTFLPILDAQFECADLRDTVFHRNESSSNEKRGHSFAADRLLAGVIREFDLLFEQAFCLKEKPVAFLKNRLVSSGSDGKPVIRKSVRLDAPVRENASKLNQPPSEYNNVADIGDLAMRPNLTCAKIYAESVAPDEESVTHSNEDKRGRRQILLKSGKR